MAIIDPSILRGIRVWRGLHCHDHEDEDGNLDFTLGGGIINVQAEIIRFVEELGLYPGTSVRTNSDLTSYGNAFVSEPVATNTQTKPADGPEAVGVSERPTWGSGGEPGVASPEAVAQREEEARQVQQDRMNQLQAVRQVRRQI